MPNWNQWRRQSQQIYVTIICFSRFFIYTATVILFPLLLLSLIVSALLLFRRQMLRKVCDNQIIAMHRKPTKKSAKFPRVLIILVIVGHTTNFGILSSIPKFRVRTYENEIRMCDACCLYVVLFVCAIQKIIHCIMSR